MARRVVTGRRRTSFSGRIPSAKNGHTVEYESQLEARLIRQMEADPEVLLYEAQPETFRWRDGSGRARRYTPDFRVKARVGWIFREVKPRRKWEADPTLKGRLQDILRECLSRGAAFEVWTESDLAAGAMERAFPGEATPCT